MEYADECNRNKSWPLFLLHSPAYLALSLMGLRCACADNQNVGIHIEVLSAMESFGFGDTGCQKILHQCYRRSWLS